MRTLLFSAAFALAFTAAPLALHAADSPEKVAVVHFSKLTPLLGDVAGWEAEKVLGQTVDAAGFKMTTVERNYRKGDSSVNIHIMDYSESAPMLQAMTAMWAFSSETTEGYQKGVTIDGVKGMEQYENVGKKGTVFLLVAGRFILQVETHGLPAPELQAWVKRVDLKKLAEVK